MAVLQEDFTAHTLWDVCEEFQILINQAIKGVDARELLSLHRLSEAVAEIASLRHISAWRFPNDGTLQALQAQLESAKSPLLAINENPEVSRADEIEGHLTQISANILNCPRPIVSPQYLAEVAALTDKYRIGIAAAIDQARKSNVDAEEELQKVVTTKDAAIATLTDQIEDLKETIAVEKADVSAQAARLDTALTTNNTAFTSKMTEWQDSLDSDRKEMKKMTELQLIASRKEAGEHVKKLVELEGQSRKLTEATARNSISTEYGTHAKKQNTTATIWSICAVGLAVGGLIALFFMIQGITDLTTPEAIWKTSVSALTLAIATYMGREAAGHRKDARDAKRMQLDLNALEPFLANMNEDTAQKLREEFAKQIFSRPLANSREHSGFTWFPGRSTGETGDKSKEVIADKN